MEKSLASYVQGELMEGENAYFCEEVGKRVAAVRRSCIKELPHTLVIHLKVSSKAAARQQHLGRASPTQPAVAFGLCTGRAFLHVVLHTLPDSLTCA